MAKLIPIRGGTEKGKFATVSDGDYESLSQFKWTSDKRGYPIRRTKTSEGWTTRRMHRDVLSLQPNEIGDHINGNKLDNRRENLRQCSVKENAQNRGAKMNREIRYKGVNRVGNRYQSRIAVDKDIIYLGLHETQIEAAKAYDRAAKYHFGEFARLNFP